MIYFVCDVSRALQLAGEKPEAELCKSFSVAVAEIVFFANVRTLAYVCSVIPCLCSRMQLAAPQNRLGLASVTDEALLARERADLLDVTAPRGVSGKRSDEANTLRVLRGDDSDLLVLGGE